MLAMATSQPRSGRRHWPLVARFFVLAFVAVMTVGPIALRIDTGVNLHVERFLVFLAVGMMLVFGYERRLVLLAGLLLAAVAGLEIVQEFLPDRHGRFLDFFVKAAGFVVGVLVGRALSRKLRRRTACPARGQWDKNLPSGLRGIAARTARPRLAWRSGTERAVKFTITRAAAAWSCQKD